jgi:2-methylcitrate dehydratase
VIADPEIDAVFPDLQRCRCVIESKRHGALETQLDFPKGDPRNPLSEDEISGKLTALAEGIADADAVGRILNAVRTTETYDDVRALTADLVV